MDSMGSGYFTNPLVYIVQVFFNLYILTFMLRFLLQVVRADFYNPLAQFLVKVTNPLLKPLRRVIPGLGGIDIASIVVMVALQIFVEYIIRWLTGGIIALPSIVAYALAALIGLAINVFFFSILIQVLISWINPGARNPATSLLYSLTEPLLRPARRLIPPIAGLDISPVIVMVGLQVLNMLLIPPIGQIAEYLA